MAVAAVMVVGGLYLIGRQSQEKKLQSKAVETVTASEICSDYEQNAVAADGRYKGYAIAVTGTIEAIDSGIGGSPYVVLSGPSGSGRDVQCLMSAGASVYGLSKGQTVTLKGVGASTVLSNVILRDCVVQ